MFDPKKAAMLIVSKSGSSGSSREGVEVGEEDVSGGTGALQAMFDALKKGDMEVAYDAFRVAVQSCSEDNEEY